MSTEELLIIVLVFISILLFYNNLKYREEIGIIDNSKWDRNLIWQSFSPISFEWLIAKYYTIEGNDVKIKRASRDKGIDLILYKNRTKIAIQIKRYKPEKNKVTGPTVRKCVGAAKQEGVNDLYIITTSTFTKPAKKAKQEFENNGINVELINGKELEKMLNKSYLKPPWPESINDK